MPFPAGTVVLCQQGNLSPPTRTHFKENSRYALDLSNTSLPSLDVVAAAPGRVAHVYADSPVEDTHAGFGFGNQVKIEHGDGYFTMYAHLEQIAVRVGDVVGTAARIGNVGFTGAAGNRHLHFSLHQGSPSGLGVTESIAMDALVLADLSSPDGFRALSSTDLADGKVDLWAGTLYASENDPSRLPLSGPPPPALMAQIQANRAQLEQTIRDRVDLEVVVLGSDRRGPRWAESVLAPVLGRAPHNPVARYLFAIAVHAADGKHDEAGKILRELLLAGPVEPTWEPWLVSWIHDRLGVIALKMGLIEEARAHFLEALRRATAEPERSFALTQLRELPPAPAPSASP